MKYASARSTKSVQKLMTFPNELYELVESKAGLYGLPFQEFVRHTLANEVSELVEKVERVDDDTAREVVQGFKEYRKGGYKSIKKVEDMDEIFE